MPEYKATHSFPTWSLWANSGPPEHRYDTDLVSAFMVLIVYETEKCRGIIRTLYCKALHRNVRETEAVSVQEKGKLNRYSRGEFCLRELERWTRGREERHCIPGGRNNMVGSRSHNRASEGLAMSTSQDSQMIETQLKLAYTNKIK